MIGTKRASWGRNGTRIIVPKTSGTWESCFWYPGGPNALRNPRKRCLSNKIRPRNKNDPDFFRKSDLLKWPENHAGNRILPKSVKHGLSPKFGNYGLLYFGAPYRRSRLSRIFHFRRNRFPIMLGPSWAHSWLVLRSLRSNVPHVKQQIRKLATFDFFLKF